MWFNKLVNWGKRWHSLHTHSVKIATVEDSFWFIIGSILSWGFTPNPKLAAAPSCSCCCVPEQREAFAAGGKRRGRCVSATGCYRASLCVCVPVSELSRGRAEERQSPVQASGKLLSSSWFAGNIASALQEWSENTRDRKRGRGGKSASPHQDGERLEMSSHRFTL